MIVEIPNPNNAANAIAVIVFCNAFGSFLLVIASNKANINCPPSKAGNGSAFSTARLIDKLEANVSRAVGDALANFEPSDITDTGPIKLPPANLCIKQSNDFLHESD